MSLLLPGLTNVIANLTTFSLARCLHPLAKNCIIFPNLIWTFGKLSGGRMVVVIGMSCQYVMSRLICCIYVMNGMLHIHVTLIDDTELGHSEH